MKRPIVTLTTDFGEGSPYVAAMKGVLLSLNPDLLAVDVSHSVPPQDIRHGAMVLRQVVPYFPEGTLHIAVVDPGVGTDREILYAEMASHRLIAPDNGLLSWMAREHPPTLLRAITESRFWREPVSATFHGRDIMAPVAAHLSLGVPPDQLGPARKQMVPLPWPELRRRPKTIEGEVLLVDPFGNLITNIARRDLESVPEQTAWIEIGEHEITGIFRTYGESPEGTLIALVGSSDLLEIAATGDSAAAMLEVGPGTAVRLSW